MRHSGCSNSVAANSSQRFTSARSLELAGQQALMGIFFRQVEHDRYRLGEHQVAVDEHRDLPGGIDLQELGAAVLAGQRVDADGLEIPAQFLERPTHADRSGRAELKDLID
jgi:hypothetical protein